MFRNIFLFLVFSSFLTINTYSQNTVFERGEALFLENKPAEAIPLLNAAAEENPGNEKIFLYLGTAYSQTGNYDKAAESFKTGAVTAVAGKDVYYYNAGNIYYLMNQFQLAEEMYSRAIRENAGRGGSYLNRANSRLNLGMKDSAVSDYKIYLNLEPDTFQRESILKLIALLEKGIAEEKEIAEQEKLRTAAAEARREELLREVMESLQNIRSETRSISAGTESIIDYQEELELLE